MNVKQSSKLYLFPVMLLCIVLLGACSVSSNKSYTFSVETGDKIKVNLDTSGDYSFSQENGHVIVKYNEETVLEGIFLTKDLYNQYLEAVDNSGAVKLAENEADNISYLFYEYEGQAGTEDNFIIWIKDSNTGMLLASLSGQEQAKAAFDRLSFTKE